MSIDNDTVYSFAQLDLGGGPLLLQVPEVGDRYYVLQFVDAWTNNFAYVGTRATGSGPGRFLIAPPGWPGQPPAGATRITSPTRVGSIVGRLAVQGEADLAAVRALQEQLSLTPLDPNTAPPPGVPERDPRVPQGLVFFEQLRRCMQAFPPAAAEQHYQQRFAPLGPVQEGDSPYPKAPPELAGDLTAGLAAGRERLEEIARGGSLAKVNGWPVALHGADYNLDWFELGTLDDPAWRLPDRTQAHLARAMVVRGGLWGNHGYEAAYSIVYEDGDGQQLTGANRYRLHFDQPPPAEAFWSITMYDLPDYYLVANPIDRYSIGDRTPGPRYGQDGSLTITIQHDQPKTRPSGPTGCPPQRAASVQPCASTSPTPRSWTAATSHPHHPDLTAAPWHVPAPPQRTGTRVARRLVAPPSLVDRPSYAVGAARGRLVARSSGRAA